MLIDVTALKATIAEILAPTGLGETISFSRTVETGYDAATGNITYTSSTYTTTGHPSALPTQEIDGITTLVGDIKVTLLSTTAPLVDDILTCSLGVYRVMTVKNTSVSSQNVTYKLTARM